MIDFGLILTYLMIGTAVLACIVSPILKIKNDTNKVKQMLTPLLILLGVIGASFFMASGEVLPEFTSSNGTLISSNLSKVVGGSLITFYVLALITIIAVIYSEFLAKFFHNGKK